jgi:cold-inducible RNA-binding protein
MATKLFVGNLSYDTTEEDLRGLFSECGKVVSAEIILDRYTSKSRGFAFVEMGSEEDARNAVEQCHERELQGRRLIVNEARPRESRPPRDFGGGQLHRELCRELHRNHGPSCRTSSSMEGG